MNTLQAFDPNSTWFNNVSHENSIDYFFTQRKIIEYDDVVDEKTLVRSQVKKNVCINFLAITLPNNQFKDKKNLLIEIEIWGDNKYNYIGKMENVQGDYPNLLLKLEDDKEIFIKLLYYELTNKEKKYLKTFTTFIPIIKRYQSIPNLN